MRKKYKQKEVNNENSKEDMIIGKRINLEQDINIIRSKSPKSPGDIMRKLDLLNKFNKIFYDKDIENKRENSSKNNIKKRRINLKNNLNLNIVKKDINVKENINNKLKIIRDSSYCKFDNEESIHKNNEIDISKTKKEEIKKEYIKKYSKDIKKEKENINRINGIKTKKIIYSLNPIKKHQEKNINNEKINEKINKKKNNNENNKESNIVHMANVEDFDKPKNNIKEKKINFDLSLNNPIGLLKKSKYKNDDILLKKDSLEKNDNNTKETFQFLVNQAYKNKDLSNSFSKYYESRAKSREQSIRKNVKNNKEILTEKKYHSRNKIFKLMKSPQNKSITNIINFKETQNEINLQNRTQSRDIKTINLKTNKNKKNLISSENLYVIKKVIINNNNSSFFIKNKKNNITNINTINNNINNIKNEKKIENDLNLDIENNIENDTNLTNDNNLEKEINNEMKDNKNICIKNYILINNLKVVNNKNSHYIHHKSKTMNNDKYFPSMETQTIIPNIYNIDLETLYILDEKMKLIITKINNYQKCKNECDNYIQYYFNEKIYDKIINFFTNKNNISTYIKMEILCFFLLVNITSSTFFNQTAILLKTIINIIHTNYFILIYYIVSLVKINYNNNNNSINLLKIMKLLENEPVIIQLKNKEKDEYNILKIIMNNLKNINNYYKMVIDNIYGKYNYIIEEEIKFPNCNKNIDLIKSNLFKYKITNIISAFFFEAYKSINNYDFIELQKFYNLFLNQNIFNDDNVENLQINANTKVVYYLPKIKKCYKYSLVLDLDETLISFQKNYNVFNPNNFINILNTRLILRPGLFEFLQNMKQFYELILFSSGTSDYVDPIVKLIEKKEKYFEFVLYRQHISFDERGQYFKNLNLLNRNLKNIIIIDDIEKNFKFHKENGICIRPFLGDYEKDKNILNLLAQILIKIRINAEETGDIRISLKKEKNNVIYSKVAINYNNIDNYS